MSSTKNLSNRAFFFDRDGIINVDRNDYTYRIQDFELMPGIIKFMESIKNQGFLIIVITNQAGIAKGLYTDHEVDQCHEHFQVISGHLVDAFYHAPGHPNYSETLSRKPDSLLFEKALAKFDLQAETCWMIGDKERDLIPAKKLGMRTILLGNLHLKVADYEFIHLDEILSTIPLNDSH